MALGKTVFAKTLDLIEAALSELQPVAALCHSSNELVAEAVDRPDAFECRHGAAKPVGLRWREAGGNNGDAHCMFLEQWHAKRRPQNGFQFGRFVGDRFALFPAPQI